MKRIAALLFLILLLGCRTETAHSAAGFACDTVVTITAYAPQETVDEALRLCSDYEAVLSKTAAGSDVDRLNRANGAPVEVHPETAALLSLAAEIGKASGGGFNAAQLLFGKIGDFVAVGNADMDDFARKTACNRVGAIALLFCDF